MTSETQTVDEFDAANIKTSEPLRFAPLFAELLGTFALAGLVIKLAQGGTLGALGISLGLSVIICIFGAMSGAHLNPAITIAQLINRQIGWLKAIMYIVAQVLGALLALLVFHTLFKAGYDNSLYSALAAQGITKDQVTQAGGLAKFATANNTTLATMAHQLGVSDFINVTIAKGAGVFTFVSEVLGSAIFGLGVGHAIYAEDKPMLETGLSVGFGLFGGLMLGGSTVILNPAVAVAVQAFKLGSFMTFLTPILVYVVGTIIGMTVGITAYRFLRLKAIAK